MTSRRAASRGNGTVTDYSEFCTFAAECGWNLKAQCDMFLYGLSDVIKDKIYSFLNTSSLPKG